MWSDLPPPATESAFFNAARPHTFLFVEGLSDRTFWEPRVDKFCLVRPQHGKLKVLEQIQIFQREGRRGYLGVLDSDWTQLDSSSKASSAGPDLVFTDTHDLESLIVASPALEKVVLAYGSADKVHRFESLGSSVRSTLLAIGSQIARLRRLSHKNGYDLKLRKMNRQGDIERIKYHRFVDEKTWRLDPKNMIQEVLNYSGRLDLNSGTLFSEWENMPDEDVWHACNGHDLAEVLAIGLRRVLGDRRSARALCGSEIEEALYLSYEEIHFRKTKLFHGVRAWESSNSPHLVLKNDSD